MAASTLTLDFNRTLSRALTRMNFDMLRRLAFSEAGNADRLLTIIDRVSTYVSEKFEQFNRSVIAACDEAEFYPQNAYKFAKEKGASEALAKEAMDGAVSLLSPKGILQTRLLYNGYRYADAMQKAKNKAEEIRRTNGDPRKLYEKTFEVLNFASKLLDTMKQQRQIFDIEQRLIRELGCKYCKGKEDRPGTIVVSNGQVYHWICHRLAKRSSSES